MVYDKAAYKTDKATYTLQFEDADGWRIVADFGEFSEKYYLGELKVLDGKMTTDAIVIYKYDRYRLILVDCYYGASLFKEDYEEKFIEIVEYIIEEK